MNNEVYRAMYEEVFLETYREVNREVLEVDVKVERALRKGRENEKIRGYK